VVADHAHRRGIPRSQPLGDASVVAGGSGSRRGSAPTATPTLVRRSRRLRLRHSAGRRFARPGSFPPRVSPRDARQPPASRTPCVPRRSFPGSGSRQGECRRARGPAGAIRRSTGHPPWAASADRGASCRRTRSRQVDRRSRSRSGRPKRQLSRAPDAGSAIRACPPRSIARTGRHGLRATRRRTASNPLATDQGSTWRAPSRRRTRTGRTTTPWIPGPPVGTAA
jgi:hypothetical protein